jgi:hypothetical protein
MGLKRQGCEVNESLPSSAEIKNEWSYTPAPHLCFHGVGKENSALQVYDLSRSVHSIKTSYHTKNKDCTLKRH